MCRRWNRRRARRIALHEDSTTALFILDALGPLTNETLAAAADDLLTLLRRPPQGPPRRPPATASRLRGRVSDGGSTLV
jgi:DNA/RNA-binding domain of Phe-tRNA-synthetase-like protein